MLVVLFPMKSEGSDLPDSIFHGGNNAVTLRRVMDSTEVSVNFRLDKINYDPSYMGNDSRLKELMNFIASIKADSTARLERLVVTSAASPEGPYEHNRYLSHERGKTLVELMKKLDPDISDHMFEVSQVVEDWDGAIKAVEEGDMPHKEEALEIMRNVPLNVVEGGKVVDTRKREMMNLDGGRVWRYMIKNYFASLRYSAVTVIFKTSRLADTLETPEPIYSCAEAGEATAGEIKSGNIEAGAAERVEEIAGQVKEYKPIIAVKSNLIYDALATPNFGAELPLGRKWSLWADYTFPWWVWAGNSRAWENLDWKLGGRYWFGNRSRRDVLTGLFAGGFGAGGYYDVEPHHKGYQGEFFAIGLEGGYAWRLSRHWHIEASAGVGYMHTNYRRYHGEEEDKHLIYDYSGKFNWIGPVKLNASIVYLFWAPKKGSDRGRRY